MKKTVFILFAFLSLPVYCQDGITFQVEKLSKPEHLLRTDSYDYICKKLVSIEPGLIFRKKPPKLSKKTNIVARSKVEEKLVWFGYHSFLYGIYRAYADHRPFVVSPDAIWLLISQGFAQHVNANPEKLRTCFTEHFSRKELVITGSLSLKDPKAPWEELFPQLTKENATLIGSELSTLLSADFSTTTLTEKAASEMTLMGTPKPYFEIADTRIICGIPEITLKGTPEDWRKILEKTKKLSKYDLEWWTKELEPVLEELVRTSEGKVDTGFWRKIFKYHEPGKGCGNPSFIDGWILKFFPYDKRGERNSLEKLYGSYGIPTYRLPEEIVTVDLKYIDAASGKETLLELWTGFIGLEQNPSTYALSPKIGWLIRKREIKKKTFTEELDFIMNEKEKRIFIRTKEIPEGLFDLKEIKNLHIEFLGEINIPDWLADLKIEYMNLSGRIEKENIQKIIDRFPHTILMINKETVHDPRKIEFPEHRFSNDWSFF